MSASLKRLRTRAERLGMRIEKSRALALHYDNRGLYRLVDVAGNYIVAGARYELDLVGLPQHLDEVEVRA